LEANDLRISDVSTVEENEEIENAARSEAPRIITPPAGCRGFAECPKPITLLPTSGVSTPPPLFHL
jgi:hypothetical protein